MDKARTNGSDQRNGRRGNRRQTLFLFIVFLLLAAGITLTGFFYYRNIVENERGETGHNLTAVANLKAAQIDAWRQERLGDAEVIAENTLLREDVEKWLQDRTSGPRKAGIVHWLEVMIKVYGYSHIMLFDSNNQMALCLPEQRGLPDPTDLNQVRQAIAERRVIFSDLYRVQPNSRIHMDLFVPLLGSQPDAPPAIGALVIRIDPRGFLYPLIQHWPDPSDTAESLLVRRDGDTVLFLNDLRHRKDSAFQFRLPLSRTEVPAVAAVLGRTGVMEGTDYRGVRVMAAVRPVPGTPWYLVCKVDSEEILEPLRERSILVWALVIVLVLACGAGMGIVSSRQATQFHRRQEEQMAEYRRHLEQTISETNILFRKVLETLPVGLYLADREGRIMSGNPAGQRIWAETRLLGLDQYGDYKAWRIGTGERLTAETWGLARAIRHGETSLEEVLEIESFDGARKIVLNSTVPVYDDQRLLLGAFVVIQDITERFRMQRQMEATNSLLNLFVHTTSREEYLRQSLALIRGWTGVDCAGIRVFDAAGQVREEPFQGFDPDFWRRSSPAGGPGRCFCLEDLLDRPASRAARWLSPGGSVWIENLDSEPVRSLLAGEQGTPCPCLEYGYGGLAIVPIRTPERVAGTLHLASREAGKPSAPAVQLAERLAPILAEAIQRFEIGEELQHHRDKLEELVRIRTRELEAANEHLRREIVERERMEKELLEMERLRILADSRKEWQETFDAITDLVSIHDKDFVVRKANRAFLNHFGLALDEVSRHRCYELFHEGTCPADGCPQCAEGNGTSPASREVADPKSGRVFLVSTYPFHGVDGQSGGVIHIARDVTDQKDREMKLILSERLASLGQMAAGIAHEINNPLATIGTCAEGLLRRLREDREEPALMKDYLGIIEEEVRRCQTITNGMLSFVRQDRGGRIMLDVHDLIEKTLALVGYQGRLRSVEVVRDFSDEPLLARVNEGGLRQVLLALMVNALDAMRDNGRLTVSTNSSDGLVRISIRDTGPGIPAALQHRIFDLFFTTKSAQGGTGLGLPIAHKIARDNGGDLLVSSAPGRGATFTVILSSS